MGLSSVEKEFNYEVAFSFLKGDEGFVYEVNDLIQDRYSTFLYSQRQKELVGKDGIDAFGEVFKDQARIVVIFYREEWGTTSWTRVEENAIKERMLDEGPDFILVVSLDGKKPKWISRIHIYFNWERFGAKGLAAVIEKRVQEYGGQIREETLEDIAERHKREASRLHKLESFLMSGDAVYEADQEVKTLIEMVKSKVEALRSIQTGLAFGVSTPQKDSVLVQGREVGIKFYWYRQYSNTLMDAKLTIMLADLGVFDSSPYNKGDVRKRSHYLFYRNASDENGWVIKESKKEFNHTKELVDFWLKEFLKIEQKSNLEYLKNRSEYK